MPAYDVQNEKLLLYRLSTGDEAAFKLLYDAYKNKIFTFVSKFVHSAADAEEIVQETFMVLWKNRAGLTLIEQPRNYVYTIARNKTYDYLSRIARNEQSITLAWSNMQQEANTTEDSLLARECGLLINSALSQLSDQKQAVFNMSRSDHMSHEEIAAATGLSKSRVKNIIVEVLKHIRCYLTQNSVIVSLLLMVITGSRP
ncbi:sigma-70 family RNA polymerase sigma factor [Mucilaginibacter sp. PAMB04168]|uniref:RNA polymerase sigma factor n=1 Tax=Mucilaginibacter sp. PAMB04168 TaxID=3138567 RepID=UPI0031F6B962